jgi:uncharacterized membrane protein
MQAVDLLEFQVYLIRKYLKMNEKKILRRKFVILLLVFCYAFYKLFSFYSKIKN